MEFCSGSESLLFIKDNIKLSKLRELITEVEPDLIYTNSYFATLTIYLLILKKLKTIPNFNILIAPCGELSEGALGLNSIKKKLLSEWQNFPSYTKI